MDNYIYTYYQAIKEGRVTVGKRIQTLYEKVIDLLERKEVKYDAKKANRAVNFVESFVHHSDTRNDLLKLELWQKATLGLIFGIVDENETRHFREVVLIIARKNGKTLFAAAIIAYCVFCDGEYGAKCYCLAPKLDQTDLVYQDFRQSVEAEPELDALVKPRKTDLYVPSTNSSVKRIAFSAKKSDGFNPHLTICDEIASWPGDAGLKQYEVMTSAMGARAQPLIVSISTAGYVNDGIYDELIRRGTAWLNGASHEKRLLPIFYMIDEPERWNDINELQKANPNLGVSVSIDYLLEQISIAENSLSKKAEFLAKHANLKQNSSQAWLDAAQVEGCFSSVPLRLEDFRKSYCVGGIDLSRSGDLPACTAVIEREQKLYVFAKFFLPEAVIDDAAARDGLPYRIYQQKGWLQASGENFIDYHDCYNWFVELIEKYRIYPLVVGYDRNMARYLIQDLEAYGFQCDDVFQGENLTPVINEFEGLVKDGTFECGDNDLLKAHFYNSAIKENNESNRRRLVKIAAAQHIDGMAALLDAMTVRHKWHDEIGHRLKNTRN